jgi:hypothetical protein
MTKAFLLLFCATTLAAQRPTILMVRSIPTPHKVILTEALSQIGSQIKNGFTSFGIVIEGDEPEVDLYLPEETTLSTALQRIVSQLPGYTFEPVSAHLIDVYPKRVVLDAADPLNLRVAKLQIGGVSAMDVFSNPYQFIPELKALRDKGKVVKACGSLGPGLGSDRSPVEITLENATIKQILDAVATASALSALQGKSGTVDPPAGWVLRSQTDQKTGTRSDTWSFVVTVPREWHNQPETSLTGKK